MRGCEMQHSGIIFIVGTSRSGTKLMGRILGTHPSVFTFHELHFFEQLWSGSPDQAPIYSEAALTLAGRLLFIQRNGYFEAVDAFRYRQDAVRIVFPLNGDAMTAPEVFKKFLEFESESYGKSRPCDQTPRNVHYLREILRLFPDARIVNMVRDPRAVLHSQKGKWKRRYLGARNIPFRESVRSWINYHPFTIAILWRSAVNAAAACYGDARVITIRYEDLANDPDSCTRKICGFLNLDYNPDMMAVPYVGSSHGEDQLDRRGIYKDKVGCWRKGGLNDTEIYILQKTAGDSMTRLGYYPEKASPKVCLLLWYALIWPFHAAAAFVLNIRRMKNVKEAVKRRLSQKRI